MATIEVTETSPNSFSVTVHGIQTTAHQVTVSPAYVATVSLADQSLHKLIQASFRFLLERESNTSILRSFDLSVIERYFPEYPKTIHRYF